MSASQYYSVTARVGVPHRHEVEVTVPLVGPAGATGPAGAAGASAWDDITGKPSTFAPTAHASTHHTGGSDPLTPANIGAAKAVPLIEVTIEDNFDLTLTTSQVPSVLVFLIDSDVVNPQVNLSLPASLTYEKAGAEVIIRLVREAGTTTGIDLSVSAGSGLFTGIFTESSTLTFRWDGVRWLRDNDTLDSNFRILGSADPTKKLAFEVDGLTTATTRTLSVPNASGTIAITQQADDIEITDATKGVILKSPNNTRWRLTINDNGTLQRVALPLIAFLCMTASALSQNVTDVVANTNGVLVAPTNFFTANLQQWVTGSYVYAPTNNFSVTNSTTLTNIPGGSFTVSANTSYIYIASAYLAGSNGYHLAIDLPSLANAVVTNTASSGLYLGTGFSSPTTALFNSTNNMRILFRSAAQTTNNPSFAIGTFRVGATGGTANLQFAQGVSSGSPSEITTETRVLIFPLP